uniref:CFAP91 domain-containing protein n=1 Tax=Caenorhabditis tropicalis TaxID=1561998 RepID=A0A1I7UP70_9PELO
MQEETDRAVLGLIEHDPEINQEPLFPPGTYIEPIKVNEETMKSIMVVEGENPKIEEQLRKAKELRKEQQRQWMLDQQRRYEFEQKQREWRINEKKLNPEPKLIEEVRKAEHDDWIASFRREVEETRKRKARENEWLREQKMKKFMAENPIELKQIVTVRKETVHGKLQQELKKYVEWTKSIAPSI